MAGGQAVLTGQQMCHGLGSSVSMGAFTATVTLPIALSGRDSWRLPAYGFACPLQPDAVAILGHSTDYDLTFWLHFTQF